MTTWTGEDTKAGKIGYAAQNMQKHRRRSNAVRKLYAAGRISREEILTCATGEKEAARIIADRLGMDPGQLRTACKDAVRNEDFFE